MKETSGGTYDKKDSFIYFIATNTSHQLQVSEKHEHLLIAVNELRSGSGELAFERVLEKNIKYFLDSGIFNLTNEHARKYNVTMDEALALAPTEIHGFDDLWQSYVRLTTTYHDRLWGFIELDQGGAENKRKTRKRYEEETGLVPIPVYHPLNDGWDYFDELCEGYDRICFGNIVQARPEVRKRLITTLFERQRKYPNVWIHILGYTPSEWANALPWYGSCDSSAWLANIRWSSGHRSNAALKKFADFRYGLRYNTNANQDDPNGYNKAIDLGAIQSGNFHERIWRKVISDRQVLND